jgi:hypothetical protein
VALGNDRLFATHSEVGLHQWPNTSNGVSLPLFQERVVPGRSTRAVLTGPNGHIYFAHGPEVLFFDPCQTEPELASTGVLPQNVTALESSGDRLVAGTREGYLYEWEAPDRWKRLPFRTGGPIFRIGCALGDRIHGWIVGARESAVHVLDQDGNLLADYRSRYPIRWVALGQQGVLGVDRFGQHLLLWNWSLPRSPVGRIRIPDQIQHLAVERETT